MSAGMLSIHVKFIHQNFTEHLDTSLCVTRKWAEIQPPRKKFLVQELKLHKVCDIFTYSSSYDLHEILKYMSLSHI